MTTPDDLAAITHDLWGPRDPDIYRIMVASQGVGFIHWKLCSEASIEEMGIRRHIFDDFKAHINVSEVFPIAFISSLDVNEDQQKHGYGKSAMRLAMKQAREKGAQIAFLRVGFDSYEDRDWKVVWYERDGFIRLKSALVDPDIPFLWHPLDVVGPSALDVRLIPTAPPRDSYIGAIRL